MLTQNLEKIDSFLIVFLYGKKLFNLGYFPDLQYKKLISLTYPITIKHITMSKLYTDYCVMA